jgi:HD-GYP domain-containing protein (c-di-GMP phosphodiesterase class II)
MSSGVRMAELLAGLSLATDLGFGQPPEHILRATRLAMRLGERLSLTTDQLAAVYDVGLLTYVGCPVYGNEVATVFGDDIEFRAGIHDVDLAGLPARVHMMREAGRGTPLRNRAKQRAMLAVTGGRGLLETMADHCAAAGDLASALGLGDEVRRSLQQVYARWDGRGVPDGVGGDEIELAARVAHVAETCEVMARQRGLDGALDVVRARSGTHLDPEVAAALVVDAERLVAGLDDEPMDRVLDDEPVARPPLSDDELDAALLAIGDFTDLRCPFFAGHARGTAALAERAAEHLDLGVDERTLLRRAALVHDAGRAGVSGSVWNRPGPLSASDRERMRLHAYVVERMFARPEPLRRIGLLAGSHHEREDGSGYHRGASGGMLSTPARVLAAADAFHALTQHRPHRPARTPDEAAEVVRAEAAEGRFHGTAVDAVLHVAGHGGARRGSRAGGPAGLTAREVDVLRLLAQGHPNKSIARQLSISPKTVGNHVEHVYEKLGVTNRATAALQAMRHGIVDTVSP